jgi:hypothetical protein
VVTCPYCQQRATTVWGKLSLGPAGSIKCLACGRRVGVPWSWTFAIVGPMFGGFWLLSHLSPIFFVPAVALWLPAFLVAYYYLVPLIGRNDF